jgi:catecholate siderophore receptor
MDRNVEKGKFDSDYQIETLSLSVMDTIDLTDQWTLSLGIRLDDFDYTNTVVTGATRVMTDYAYDDALWNYQAGLMYKINEQGNVYFNYSTSSEINGGESDLGANCGYGGLCGADATQVGDSKPETVENLELGTKWNVLNEKLLFTAAAFRITKDDVMESVGNAYASIGTLNTGRNRVEGIELSLTGNLTEQLSMQFGVATMESEVLESFDQTTEGRVLSNFANDSLFLQVRYELTPAFAFGGTARYSSEMYTGQPDSAAGWNKTMDDYSYEVPAYTVYDLFASYDINKKTNLMLNVGNVLDTDYYLAGYRSGSFTYKGDERSIKLTLSYDF